MAVPVAYVIPESQYADHISVTEDQCLKDMQRDVLVVNGETLAASRGRSVGSAVLGVC